MREINYHNMVVNLVIGDGPMDHRISYENGIIFHLDLIENVSWTWYKLRLHEYVTLMIEKLWVCSKYGSGANIYMLHRA